MVRVPDTEVCVDRYPLPNEEGEFPWTMLSGLPEVLDVERGEVWDAEALCADRGKRVCRLEEWVGACLGPDGSRYPWGDELGFYVPGAGRQLPCNGDHEYIGLDERLVYLRDPGELWRVDQREPSGFRETCVSASRMRDAIGQVEQWVKCPGVGRYGWCLVGGHPSAPRSCRNVITRHSPRWHFAATGARCCLDLEQPAQEKP